MTKNKTDLFLELIDIVKKLRAPNGCPWDKVQTFETLIPCIKEESDELVEAICEKEPASIREELGDILLHVVMLSLMAEEDDLFSIEDVMQDISAKMIRRHPHVFGNAKAETVQDVVDNWEKIKEKEKQGKK